MKVMYLVVLNVDPHSLTDASWGIKVLLEMAYLG